MPGRGSVFLEKLCKQKAAALKQTKEFNAATQFCCCSSFYSDVLTSCLALVGGQRILGLYVNNMGRPGRFRVSDALCLRLQFFYESRFCGGKPCLLFRKGDYGNLLGRRSHFNASICSAIIRREAKTKVSGFYTWLEIRLSGCLGGVCAQPPEKQGGPGPDYGQWRQPHRAHPVNPGNPRLPVLPVVTPALFLAPGRPDSGV
jgi:hypothetical protein